MTSPPLPEVNLADLGPRTRIGVGGQGSVYALAEEPGLVYKEYTSRFVDDVDVATLNRFVRLAAEAGDPLLDLAAWPTAVVRKEGVVRGFLMPRVPERFTVRIALPSGPATVLAQMQYLLNNDDYLRARGLPVDDRLRLEILRDTGEALAHLHGLGICVGDLSPNNLLFSLESRPRCYFLDCDAMRLDGDSVLAQAETPEWHLPDATAEELATPASDAYKYGLLAVRLFAGDQQVRDAGAAKRRMRGGLRRLAERSLDADPAARPGPAQWFTQLDRAIERTPPAPPPPVAEPAPVPPPRRPGPRPARVGRTPSRNSWLVGLPALVALIAVVAGLLSDGSESPRPSTLPPGFTYQPRLGLPAPTTVYRTPLIPSELYPTLLTPALPDPSLLYPKICPLADAEAGPGVNPDSTRVKTATEIVGSFLCGLNIDSTAFALEAEKPSKTQRTRFATLAGKGPFRAGIIIGVRGGSDGGPQVNVVFEPTRSGSGCWRSRLSLSEDGVASIGAVSRASCV